MELPRNKDREKERERKQKDRKVRKTERARESV